MSQTLADTIREIYRFWNVVHTRLPQERVVEILNRKIKKRLMDLRLTSGNYAVKISNPIRPAQSNFSLSVPDLGDVVRVEARARGTNDEWQEARSADFGDWSRYAASGENFYSVYGASPEMKMQVSGDYRNLEYRLIYEAGDTLKRVFSSHIGIQEEFQPILFYDAAIEAGMAVNDRSADWMAERREKITYLASDLREWESRWKKWTTFDKTQSVGQREAFDSGQNDSLVLNMRIPW